MSFLSVTRSLTSGTNPTETQLDTMRTDLLNYFNGTVMDENNIATGGMLFTTLSKALDNASMKWTSSHALIKYISATSLLQIENTLGNIVFSNYNSSETDTLTFSSSTGNLTLASGGLLKAGQGQGSLSADVTWLLARYRKPRLEYTDANTVTSENNTGTASETILVLRDRLTTMVDRTMSLASTANGYDAADSGAAVSGIRDGLARANNTWYYVYGVLVQYGTDNDGSKSIMVADTTSPVQANCSTLDSRFGAGKWVYLGVIRNGYNDGINPNIIVAFIYDEYGTMRFTSTTEDGKGNGLLLASANSSSSSLEYTLTFGTGASDLPVTATRVTFTGYRSTYQFFLRYIVVATSEVHAVSSSLDYGGTATGGAVIQLDVPPISGYKVTLYIASNSTNQRIMLAGVTDHYV